MPLHYPRKPKKGYEGPPPIALPPCKTTVQRRFSAASSFWVEQHFSAAITIQQNDGFSRRGKVSYQGTTSRARPARSRRVPKQARNKRLQPLPNQFMEQPSEGAPFKPAVGLSGEFRGEARSPATTKRLLGGAALQLRALLRFPNGATAALSKAGIELESLQAASIQNRKVLPTKPVLTGIRPGVFVKRFRWHLLLFAVLLAIFLYVKSQG